MSIGQSLEYICKICLFFMSNINFSDSDSQKFRPSNKNIPFSWMYLAAIQLFTYSLLIAIPQTAMAQANRKSFRICSRDLLSVGLSEVEVTKACGAALKPRGLSKCVTRIYDSTTETLSAEDILSNCQRVRRVEELGTCVETINKSVNDTSNQAAILESCRLSLLPKRFSFCVVGLRRNIELPTEQLLSTCLNPNEDISETAPSEEN